MSSPRAAEPIVDRATKPADIATSANEDAAAQSVSTGVRRPQSRAKRRRVRRSLIVTHRWLSLVLGLILLVITTSGAILVYKPEFMRWLNSDAYAVSGGPASVGPDEALDAVAAAHPEFAPTTVIAEHGVLRVTDFVTSYTVDPATGQVLGEIDAMPTWLGWTENLHECFLTCEEEPGYIATLAEPVPGTTWLGYEGTEPVTYGGMILGLTGLLLLFLALSGLWLWFPRRHQWKAAVRIRRTKGRFARDTDLHKIIGMIALPLLLLWAWTGMGFEFGPVEHAWYAITPGVELQAPEPVSAEGEGPDIGADAAAAAALAAVPGSTLAAVDLPPEDDPTAVYSVWVADGIDPYTHSDYPGDVNVAVDRRTAETTITYGLPEEPAAQTIWDTFNYTVHAGVAVNWAWRVLWVVLGLAPLALAVTGVSTWLVRRKNKRRRKSNQLDRRAPATAAPPSVPSTAQRQKPVPTTTTVPTTTLKTTTVPTTTVPTTTVPSTAVPPTA